MALIIRKFPEGSYRKIVTSAFYGFSGVFVGLALNDIWRLFDLPGNRELSDFADIDKDELYQYAIGLTIALTSFVHPIDSKNTNNLLLGLGTIVGSRIANKTERGDKII